MLKQPDYKPTKPFPDDIDKLHQEGNWLWIPLHQKWRDISEKPEEIVRQKFIRVLVEAGRDHFFRSGKTTSGSLVMGVAIYHSARRGRDLVCTQVSIWRSQGNSRKTMAMIVPSDPLAVLEQLTRT